MLESRQAELLTYMVFMTFIPAAAVVLRCWSGLIQKERRWGLDDTLAVATLVCLPSRLLRHWPICSANAIIPTAQPFLFIVNGIVLSWVLTSLDPHAPPEKLLVFIKLFYAEPIINDVALTLPKLSALLFYHRIFGRTHRWFHCGLWVLGTVVCCWLVTAMILDAALCISEKGFWDPTIHSRCLSRYAILLGTAIPNIPIDLGILLLPMPLLWKLHTTTRRKISLAIIFVCGYWYAHVVSLSPIDELLIWQHSVLIVSVGRTVCMVRTGQPLRLQGPLTPAELTYMEWTLVEAPLLVFSVCLPNIFHLCKCLREEGVKRLVSRKGSAPPSARKQRMREKPSTELAVPMSVPVPIHRSDAADSGVRKAGRDPPPPPLPLLGQVYVRKDVDITAA